MTRKTVRVRKVTMAGGGGGAGFEQGKGYTCLSFCRFEVLLKPEQGITIFYRLGRVFLVKSFYRVTKKTIRVRKVTLAGVWGSADSSGENDESGGCCAR